MIILPEKDLHRLRQIRDDLEWLHKIVQSEVYKNQPWRHYTTTIATTRGVVGSLIRNIEWDQKEKANADA